MKKTFLLLAAYLICLTACQNAQAPSVSVPTAQGDASSIAVAQSPSAPEDSSASISSVSAAPSTAPQTADNLLTVPVKILMEYDNPVIFATPEKGAELGTSAQLDRYME